MYKILKWKIGSVPIHMHIKPYTDNIACEWLDVILCLYMHAYLIMN